MKSKDWVGNQKSIYTTLGASNHTDGDREINDYYATDPKAVSLLLEVEEFQRNIWEPACGQGHMSQRLLEAGYNVYSTDLIDRGFGVGGIDFLNSDLLINGDIITNPPYKFAQEFVEHALDIVKPGAKVAMFLKLTFCEGKARKELFNTYPPKRIYVSSSRIKCAKNGDFDSISSSAVAYAWFVWEKGFLGTTEIKWIN